MEAPTQDTCPILWHGEALPAPVGSLTLRVCMFCGEHLGEKDWCGGTLTHGSCDDCMDATLADIGGVRIAGGDTEEYFGD